MRLVTERRADRATLALRYQEETLEQENRRRRREVAVLRQEPAFAKKSGGGFNWSSQHRLNVMN